MGKCISSPIKQTREINYNDQQLLDQRLRDINITQVPKVFYQYKTIRARVIKVYDGDTITVVFLIDDTPIKIKVRLKGIDTPEVRSKKGRLEDEKIAGKKCRNYLRSFIGDKIVNLTIYKWGKYAGRVIGEIIYDNANISSLMLEKGYAVSYDGKTKKHMWTQQELTQIINTF